MTNLFFVKFQSSLTNHDCTVVFRRELKMFLLFYYGLVFFFRGDKQDDRGNCKFKGQRRDLFSVQGWPWLQHCNDITGTFLKDIQTAVLFKTKVCM